MYFLNCDSKEKLERILKLPARGDEQDWDIELGDQARAEEFIAMIPSPDLTPDDRLALVALAIASLDRRLLEGGAIGALWRKMEGILSAEPELYQGLLKYWDVKGEATPDADGFEISPYVRQHLLSHRREPL